LITEKELTIIWWTCQP